MYQNRVFLIGFTGDLKIHTTNNSHENRTVFSLATKSSYRDKETGKYIDRTE